MFNRQKMATEMWFWKSNRFLWLVQSQSVGWSKSASFWINSNDLTFSLTFSLTGMTISLGNHPQITLFQRFFVGQILSFALSSGERHNVLHQQHALFNGLRAILDNPKEVLLDMYIYYYIYNIHNYTHIYIILYIFNYIYI